MRSQRVGHDWVTERSWTDELYCNKVVKNKPICFYSECRYLQLRLVIPIIEKYHVIKTSLITIVTTIGAQFYLKMALKLPFLPLTPCRWILYQLIHQGSPMWVGLIPISWGPQQNKKVDKAISGDFLVSIIVWGNSCNSVYLYIYISIYWFYFSNTVLYLPKPTSSIFPFYWSITLYNIVLVFAV